MDPYCFLSLTLCYPRILELSFSKRESVSFPSCWNSLLAILCGKTTIPGLIFDDFTWCNQWQLLPCVQTLTATYLPIRGHVGKDCPYCFLNSSNLPPLTKATEFIPSRFGRPDPRNPGAGRAGSSSVWGLLLGLWIQGSRAPPCRGEPHPVLTALIGSWPSLFQCDLILTLFPNKVTFPASGGSTWTFQEIQFSLPHDPCPPSHYWTRPLPRQGWNMVWRSRAALCRSLTKQEL